MNNVANFERGDIISFIPEGKEITLIKRIIWLPWETVKIINNNVEICNNNDSCTVLAEWYLNWVITEVRNGELNEFKLDKWFFVLGDNRGFSTDSINCFSLGCSDELNYEVPLQNIEWKVFLKLFPTVKFY
jgi:hypothetical protein